MKIFKWSSVILVTVAVTCILLLTFTQEPFGATAPVKIFGYDTESEYPVYLYVAAAFVIGLFIGFCVTAYYYITGQAGIRNKKKEIARLEGIVRDMAAELETVRKTAGQATKRATESMKAVGEKDLPVL
jgi:uncharacterized membrane protein YciS (DUF1049 family)